MCDPGYSPSKGGEVFFPLLGDKLVEDADGSSEPAGL